MLLGARASLWRKTSPGRWYETSCVHCSAVGRSAKMADLYMHAGHRIYALKVDIRQSLRKMSRLCDLNKYCLESICLVYILAKFSRVTGISQVIMTITTFPDLQYIYYAVIKSQLNIFIADN